MVPLGLGRGKKGCYDRRQPPEALWAEMAPMCIGAIAIWLFQDSLNVEVKHILDHSDTKLIVGERQEEVDKSLSIKERERSRRDQRQLGISEPGNELKNALTAFLLNANND
jgi:long-subunit acyl-CoA synthetase (AMP-forming)